MSQTSSNSARKAALARRIALSTQGKKAMGGKAERTRAASTKTAPATAVAAAPAVSTPAPTAAPVTSYTAPQSQGNNARKAALARRIAMSKGGKGAVASNDRTRSNSAVKAASTATNKEGCGCGCGGKNKPAETATAAATTTDMGMSLTASLATTPVISPNLKKIGMNSTRAATLARRKAMSTKGKAALKGGTVSEASAARAANPNISSRELAQTLRTQRSQKGKTQTKQAKTVATGPGRHRKAQAAAEDAPWKVGVTETASGQSVTGTMVDRIADVTGNEASTCRSVTGTEYMGADVFKSFCQTDTAPAAFNRVSVTSTATGNSVSGNAVGRSAMVTGDEPGSCKAVTGTEYVSAEDAKAFCGTKAPSKPAKFSMAQTSKGKAVSGSNVGRSGNVTGDETGSGRQLTGSQYMESGEGAAPAKVGQSATLRGGSVSGTLIGRSENVTGDEPGSCRNVTGDEYVSAEQYGDFCKKAPAPTDQKVGVSNTLMGKSVTGTMTDRGLSVTGNEPGTCQAVTGTPYAGAAQTSEFCSGDRTSMVMARAQKGTGNVGANMTGIQPAIAGVMTGADKGACGNVSGTPYVGADQFAAACPATPATTASSDYPQAIGAVAQQFSVNTPTGGAAAASGSTGITGEQNASSNITGPFGMATGKVTGTEDARFGKGNANAVEIRPEPVAQVAGREKARISGEGQDSGLNITGDDWGRGNNVTGTEGMSSAKRNTTLRAINSMDSMKEMAAIAQKRNEEVALPVSKVTGASGSTEKGSLITYSGGARG